MGILDIFKPDPSFKAGQNTQQKNSTGFFERDPDKTLDIFGGNMTSGIAPDPDFRLGMGTDPEYQAELKAAKAKEDAFKQSDKAIPRPGPIKELNETLAETNPKSFREKLNNVAGNIFDLQGKNPEGYKKVLSALDIYTRIERGDTIAEAILGNSKFNAEQASALLKSAKAEVDYELDTMKVLQAKRDFAEPAKVQAGELEIAKSIVKGDVDKDDIDAIGNFIAGRAKTIQSQTGMSYNEAVTLAYQLAQQEGGGLKDTAKTGFFGKSYEIDPQGTTNNTEADHIKANDEAKAAGQDAYTLGSKTYKVQ